MISTLLFSVLTVEDNSCKTNISCHPHTHSLMRIFTDVKKYTSHTILSIVSFFLVSSTYRKICMFSWDIDYKIFFV